MLRPLRHAELGASCVLFRYAKETGMTEEKKKKPRPPMVKLDGEQWILVKVAGTTAKLTNGTKTVHVLASRLRPMNNSARSILK